MSVIKTGLIGYGYWGTNLFRNLMANPLFDLVMVAEQGEARREAVGKLFGSGRVTASAEELLDDLAIEAVFIATPVATHFPLALRAINAGKHVFVEKPICSSSAEAEKLVEAAEAKGVTLMVDHTFLFTGAVQWIGDTVRRGELGKLCYYDSTRINLGLFQPDTNVLWDLAPHDLSILDYLLDEEPVRISASGYCHLNRGLPDICYLTLHYPSDVVAHLNLSWMSPTKVRRIALGGTSKMMVWDDLNPEERIKVFNSGIQIQPEDQRDVIVPGYRIGDITSPRIPNKEALVGVLNHFAGVIAGKEASIMDGRRALRIVRTLEMAQKVLDVELAASQPSVR